ncbi:MAG: TolC family outer membrane protein [Candidatus Eutrophobiaceae bacterium]
MPSNSNIHSPKILSFLALCLLPWSVDTSAGLVEIYQQALENDAQHQQGIDRLRAALEQIPQARAKLLPDLSLNAFTKSRDQRLSTDGFGRSGEIDANIHGYQLKLSQPLFNLPSWLGLDIADERVARAQVEYQNVLQDLALRIGEGYFNVLAALESLKFAHAEKRSLSEQLFKAKQEFEVGATAITDVHEVQAGYDRALAAEIKAANELENTNEALYEMLGHYPRSFALLQEEIPLSLPAPENIISWTITAMQYNLEVRLAQHDLELAKQKTGLINAEHYPSVNMFSESLYNRSQGQFGKSDVYNLDFGVEFSVPLYQGGSVSSRYREALEEQNRSKNFLEQKRREARRTARQAYLGVVSGISQVRALKQALISSESALFATRKGFEIGTRTAIDVVMAENNTSLARRNHAQARYKYLIDRLKLKRASGKLALSDLQEINNWLGSKESIETLQNNIKSIPEELPQ